jgi:glutathione S-transferase
MQDANFIARQMGKVSLGLQVLNDDLAKNSALGKSKWCVNGAFSLADIAVGCMLAYVNLRFSAVIDLATDYPNLAELQIALHKRPSFQDTQPVP